MFSSKAQRLERKLETSLAIKKKPKLDREDP